jgi:hypothetical protein
MCIQKDHPDQKNQKNYDVKIAVCFAQNYGDYSVILATLSSVIISVDLFPQLLRM